MGIGARVVRRSSGRGRVTCILLCVGIALFRQGKCLGRLLRRQCAVDAVNEVLVCCRHARPPYIAVAAGDIRIRSTGQGQSPTRHIHQGSSSHSFEGVPTLTSGPLRVSLLRCAWMHFAKSATIRETLQGGLVPDV